MQDGDGTPTVGPSAAEQNCGNRQEVQREDMNVRQPGGNERGVDNLDDPRAARVRDLITDELLTRYATEKERSQRQVPGSSGWGVRQAGGPARAGREIGFPPAPRRARKQEIRVEVARAYSGWPVYVWFFMRLPPVQRGWVTEKLVGLDGAQLVTPTVGNSRSPNGRRREQTTPVALGHE